MCTLANSCKESEVDSRQLVLSTDLISAQAEGGSYTVTFPADSFAPEEINAQCKEDWVNSFEITPGQISFRVNPNTSLEQREVWVDISSPVNKTGFTVRQDAEAAPKNFIFDITKVTATEIVADVTPVDESMYYCLMSIDKAMYETDLKGDNTLLQEGIIAKYEEMARVFNVFLRDILEGQLHKGKRTGELFEDMTPETDYYIFAVGMTFEGEFITPVEKVLVTTEPITMQDLSFDVEFDDITCESVNIKITPSDLDAVYYLTFGEKSRLINDDGSPMTDEQLTVLLQNEVFNLIKLGTALGQTKEEVLEQICYSGVSNGKIDDLYASKDYYAFTVGIDKSGYFNSKVSKKEFRTDPVPPSDNKFTMTITPSVNYATVNVTVSNPNDSYYMACTPSASYPGDDKLAAILAEEKVETTTGNLENAKIPYLTPDTEYTFFVLGFRAGTATTPIQKQTVRTLSNETATNITLTVTLEDLNEDGVTAVVTGDPASAPFYFDITYEERGLDEIKAQMDQLIKESIEYGIAKDAKDFYNKAASYGTDMYRYSQDPGRKFKIFAFGLDLEKGEMIENTLTFSEPFEIPAREVSQETISVKFDKCFDMDALAELYPDKYGQYTGMSFCVLPVSIEASAGVQQTLMTVFTNDITNEEMYPDDILIMNLERPDVGNSNRQGEYFLTYGQLHTIIAVGIDENGNYTKVFRETVKKSRTDVSPVEEYIAPSLMRLSYIGNYAKDYFETEPLVLRKPDFERAASSVSESACRQQVELTLHPFQNDEQDSSSPFIQATNFEGKAKGMFEKKIDRRYHLPASR